MVTAAENDTSKGTQTRKRCKILVIWEKHKRRDIEVGRLLVVDALLRNTEDVGGIEGQK